MKTSILITILFAWLSPRALSESLLAEPLPQQFLKNASTIRSSASAGALLEIQRLCRDADKNLQAPLLSVVEKAEAGPSGDKHDYVSLSTYYWPNPNTPDGLPYIYRDGEKNPEIERYDYKRLDEMVTRVRNLGLSYHLTGDEKYAEKAAQQLRAWFLDEQTRMNPHLRFAQMVKGQGTEGRPWGVIDTWRLCLVCEIEPLLAKSKHWPQSDHTRLQEWFANYLKWLRESKQGKIESNDKNNHGMWYDVQVTAYALFCGKPDLAKQVLEEAKARRIASQIEPDGSMPAELRRTQSLPYVLFNLNATFWLATFGDRAGVDLWRYQTSDGRGIRKAIDWVVPYAKGEKTWEYKQITPKNFAKFVPLLRQAAHAFNDPAYDRVIESIKDVGPELQRADLFWPPL